MRTVLAALTSDPSEETTNLAGLERVLVENPDADLVVTGEALVQSFAALDDDPAHDLALGWALDDPRLGRLRALAAGYGTTVCLGLLERDGGTLYSTALVIGPDGGDLAVQRRLSDGWHAEDAPPTCAEGSDVVVFEVGGRRVVVSLCGDGWVVPDRLAAAGAGLLLWPLYRTGWQAGEEAEYAEQAASIAADCLLVGAVHASDGVADTVSAEASPGGAWWLHDGAVAGALPIGRPGCLVVDLP